ncbi:MAG TPA: hypothetical protein PLU43_12295, partial [Lachnospiraceae bacterium]|nr:hypothetical protein [Lachnospiraceae bacterium]
MKETSSFKELCKKFERSVIFFFEFVMYAACFATFFLLFAIDNREIIGLSRTAAVTMSTYVIMLFLLTGIYGKYDVGMRKTKQIVFSLVLAAVFTDIITYFELTIMKTNEANNATFKIENVGIFFSVMIIQTLLIILVTYAGNAFYFWINKAERCLIITSEEEDSIRVAHALEEFKKRYHVCGIVRYDTEDLTERIVDADTVVLYEVPVELRTDIVDFCYQNLKNIYFNPHIADILEQNSKPVVVDDISFFTSRF